MTRRCPPGPAVDWQRVYAAKLATVEDAIRCIPRGRTILVASGAAEPEDPSHGGRGSAPAGAHTRSARRCRTRDRPAHGRAHSRRCDAAGWHRQDPRGRARCSRRSARNPWREASREKLVDGSEIVVRPVRITDEEALQRLFYELSDESTYLRFMGYKRAHPHEEIQKLVDLDYERSMALVACLPDDGAIIGMSRYDVDPATHLAEIAFVVRDDWQCRGVGTLLMRRMAEIARDRGVAGFAATMLASNKPMLLVFHHSGLKIESTLKDGVYELKAYFRPNATGGT